MNWGGSGIEKVVFDWILENVPEWSTVIELGAEYFTKKEIIGQPYDSINTPT